MFDDGINDSEPDINFEARGKKFWMIPRNIINPAINKLEMSNLQCSPLGRERGEGKGHLNEMKTPLCSLVSLLWQHKNRYFAYSMHYLQKIADDFNFGQKVSRNITIQNL